MTLDGIKLRIDALVQALFTPAERAPTDLDPLFDALLNEAADSQQAEQAIWSSWAKHPDPKARASMYQVVAAFEKNAPEVAGPLLDKMVAQWPGWAEAWNKRATLRFTQERDAESLDDIARTLAIEPRHFGAISGFGQICLRAGDLSSALLAFEHALTINPHLYSLRQAVTALREQAPRTLH